MNRFSPTNTESLSNTHSAWASSMASRLWTLGCFMLVLPLIRCWGANDDFANLQDLFGNKLNWSMINVDDVNSVDKLCVYRKGFKIVGFGLRRTYGDLILLKVVNEETKQHSFNEYTDSNGRILSTDCLITRTFAVVETDASFKNNKDVPGKVKLFVNDRGPGMRFANDVLWEFSWQGVESSSPIMESPNTNRELNPAECNPNHKKY